MSKIEYVKTNWENEKTPLNQTNMNHIESGIKAACDKLDNIPLIAGSGSNSLVGNDLETNTAISENVVSFGTGNKCGLKGYYWSAINISAKTITLATAHTGGSSVTCGYAVGDIISIVNGKRYDECSKITTVNGSVITVNTLPFTTVSTAAGDWTDYCIYCPEKADIGLVDLGRDCFVAGNGNKGGNWCSIVAGRQNNSIGQYGAVFGRENKVSYAGFSSGRNNKTTGWYSASTGRNNTVTGLTSFATGESNTLSGIESFAAGQTNNIRGWRGYIIGFDNKIYSHAGFVIGRNNTIDNSNNDDGAFDVAIGMNNTVLNSYAVSIGKDNYLSNYNSKCFGTGLKSGIANQILFGQYNFSSSDPFVFGYGTSDTSRKNIATISSEGNLKIAGNLTLDTDGEPQTLTAKMIAGINHLYCHKVVIENGNTSIGWEYYDTISTPTKFQALLTLTTDIEEWSSWQSCNIFNQLYIKHGILAYNNNNIYYLVDGDNNTPTSSAASNWTFNVTTRDIY